MRALALALVLLGAAAPLAGVIRERNGYGRLVLWQAGHVTGPLAKPAHGLGRHGHHAWSAAA